MSYVLTYSVDGHEMTFRAESLDKLDQRIHMLNNDEVHPGATIAILRIEEDYDGPRTWQIEYPPAPPAGTRVLGQLAQNTTELTVGENGTIEYRGTTFSWEGALEAFRTLTEVVETEVEAAARRLRERLERDGTLNAGGDANIVLRHVLNGGTL